MKSELKELLTYFSPTNYDEGYVEKETGKFVYAHKKLPVTDALLDGHLNGKPIGVNTSLDEWGRTQAVVFDIDCKQDSDASRRDEYLAKITDALARDGVPFLTFKSGSGNGRHVFVLFSRMVPKSFARLFGAHYAELINVLIVDGIFEVFPKFPKLDAIENIALPLARKSEVIGEFKIVPFDPATWKPTLTAYQLEVRSKIAEAFVEDADGKVAAYGVKVPTLAWNSDLGIKTIAKAGFAYLSADGEHMLRAFAWMIKVIIGPDSETPILLLQGEAGSGKSVTSKNIVMLLDPQKAALSTAPKDVKDLFTAVAHSYVVAFDNLSGVYGDLSDTIASIVTGGGIKNRLLHTNGELFAWEGMRPIILNGIDPAIVKNDLVSRTVPINLQPFEGEFVDKQIITERFMQARPRLLHALLTLCHRVKAKLPDVDHGAGSRMVGYAFSPEDFVNAIATQVDPVSAFKTAVGFEPDDWQKELLTVPLNEPFVQVLASRGTGKSQTAAVLAFSYADSNPGVTVLLIAPSERQSNELFRYINTVRGKLPLAHPTVKDTQSELHLSNGSRILVLPGTADTIRGFRCHLLILEEAARLKDDLFTAVVPSVLGTGRIIAITTPAGRAGWFYDLWIEGKAYRITARSTDLPRLAETVARDRLIMRGAQFRTEHLLEWAGSGEAFFDFETVSRAFCDRPALEILL